MPSTKSGWTDARTDATTHARIDACTDGRTHRWTDAGYFIFPLPIFFEPAGDNNSIKWIFSVNQNFWTAISRALKDAGHWPWSKVRLNHLMGVEASTFIMLYYANYLEITFDSCKTYWQYCLVWFGIIYLPSGESQVYTCFPYHWVLMYLMAQNVLLVLLSDGNMTKTQTKS